MTYMPKLAAPSQQFALKLLMTVGCLIAFAVSMMAVPPQIAAAAVIAVPILFALYRHGERTGRDVRGAALIAIMALLVASMVAAPGATHAQSIGIDFDSSDLDIFFEWFNIMFNAILPIGLLGAGIAAGVAFVWVVSRMLTKAFTSMLGGLGGA